MSLQLTKSKSDLSNDNTSCDALTYHRMIDPVCIETLHPSWRFTLLNLAGPTKYISAL